MNETHRPAERVLQECCSDITEIPGVRRARHVEEATHTHTHTSSPGSHSPAIRVMVIQRQTGFVVLSCAGVVYCKLYVVTAVCVRLFLCESFRARMFLNVRHFDWSSRGLFLV